MGISTRRSTGVGFPVGIRMFSLKLARQTLWSLWGDYLFDNISVKTFTVTMSRLTLKDTGVYYCGVEQWGPDKYTKICLRVRKAPTVPTVTPSAPGTVTEEVTATALTASSTTGKGNESLSTSPPDHTTSLKDDHKVDTHIMTGAVLAVIVCVFLVAAVILFTQRRATRSLDKKPTVGNGPTGTEQAEDVAPGVCYEEIGAGVPRLNVFSVYCLQEQENQQVYSTAQLPGPLSTPESCGVYSLAASPLS